MATALLDDPVPTYLRRRLEKMYGERLARMLLFNSRARGDHRADSDHDVAVFLRDMPGWWAELARLADLDLEMIDTTGHCLDAKPYALSEWTERTSLMSEIRREGINF